MIQQKSQPVIPVIGVYTQNRSIDPQIKQTYILLNSVQFLQNGGAKVVPLFYNQSQKRLLSILKQINGVFFPGGNDYDIQSKYVSNADFILKYAIQQNKNGKPFPLWGTCLGHQLLSYLTSGYDANILKKVKGQNDILNNIKILKPQNQFFKNWQQIHFTAAQTKINGFFYYSHNWAIYKDYFEGNENLRNFWDLVATTTSQNGQEFVSMQKAKDYPFYCVQYHPQVMDKTNTQELKQVEQMYSNLFAEECKQSKNKFNIRKNLELIQNYKYYAGQEYGFDEFYIYIFNEQKEIERLDSLDGNHEQILQQQ